MNQWGCANRPAKEGFWAQDGWLTTESGQPYQPKFVWVPYRMSRECRYDKRDDDWRCRGCTRERKNTKEG
jgi:hypothetical protein